MWHFRGKRLIMLPQKCRDFYNPLKATSRAQNDGIINCWRNPADRRGIRVKSLIAGI